MKRWKGSCTASGKPGCPAGYPAGYSRGYNLRCNSGCNFCCKCRCKCRCKCCCKCRANRVGIARLLVFISDLGFEWDTLLLVGLH